MDDGGDEFIQSAANKAAAARAVRRGADAAAPLVGVSVVVVPEPEPEPEPEPVPVVLPRFNQL
mgnify:CR=1 FL=1